MVSDGTFARPYGYDGDGYYMRDWGNVHYCNERNASIHPGATEIPGNGIDSNGNDDDNSWTTGCITNSDSLTIT